MYVVTFYSFKGGPGRSMALVNVAAELLSKGRRVLIVDFDLEAPGLDTFPMTLDRPIQAGLVEMITDYLAADGDDPTPSIDQYVYSGQLEGVRDGKLWIMPAGRQDSSYDSRFKSIDWQDFYDNEGGFLFFEDLKVQWEERLDPDYVLVDSRTGHTDIGGICTRQLPDCVVAMFFPNEQNIRGLRPVVQDIRAEADGPLQKFIELHFVMGNVPDLDDEDEILSHVSSLAKRSLEYRDLAATIHHFNSLSMLKQRLLLIDRPKSKIALEYRRLAAAIIQRNLEDREGAIAVLEQALAELRSDSEVGSDVALEGRLQKIRTLHSTDVEILRHLARFRRAQRRIEEALDVFDQVLQHDSDDPESLVGRAEILTIMSKTDQALPDLIAFFDIKHASPFAFALATRLLMMNDKEQLFRMLESPSIPLLPVSAVMEVGEDLRKSYDTCEYAITFLRRWLSRNSEKTGVSIISNELGLSLIAAGHFDEAKTEILGDKTFETLDIPSSFNFAMAEWGLSEEIPRALFESFVKRISTNDEITDPNNLQCVSLANWAAGNLEIARDYLERVTARFAKAPRTIFSCWTYLYRSPRSFREDLDAMRAFYETGRGQPAFIRGGSSLFGSRDPIQ